MYKLSFSKPMYKTYKDGKITLCTYKCTMLDAKTKEVFSDFVVTGKSVCSDNDTIDVKVGRNLAESRAKYQAYSTAKELMDCNICLEDVHEQFEETLNIISFYNSLNYLKKNELKHINFLKKDL